jgi:succinate dehydrogenase / fumarate reductase cytochrome b subunit
MTDIAMKKKRPVWFNLNLLNLPLPARVSILHRVSGALLFVLAFWLLYLLEGSLASAERYEAVRQIVANPLAKLLLLVVLWAFLHHFFAGIRYLLLDLHVGIQREKAKSSSIAVFIVSLALTVLLGGWLLWR